MLVRSKAKSDVLSSEITPEQHFVNRRAFMRQSAVLGAGSALGASLAVPAVQAGLQPDDEVTPEDIVTSYNNFYEFGTAKSDPAENAHTLTTDPWSIEVSGEANKTGTFQLEDVLSGLSEEDRVYRFRCVEAWSMVVPWRGIPLKAILEQFEPNGNAKYVEFKTLVRPSEMNGQRGLFNSIDWPYVEGLRMDEAYLPNQNGAPLRLMVPWKYGFKSVKSIVSIRFTEHQPRNTWNILAANEYGFFANVNPAVSHPRWSQASERRLPSSLFNQNRRATLPFNGYAEEVAGLYAGMDLRKHF